MIRQPKSYRFEDFEVTPGAAELRRSGAVIHLEPRVFGVLVYLIEHRDRVVEKQELLDEIWSGDFVTENALTKAVGRLRRALSEDAQLPRYLQTVHTRGYRFIAQVQESEGTKATVETGTIGGLSRTSKDIASEVIDRVDGEVAESASPRLPRRRFPRLAVAGPAIVLGAIAVLTIGGPLGLRDRLFGVDTRPEIRSLAVLPLVNLSGDPDQAYFADGLHEALITDLSKIGSLRVISRQSAMRFRESEKSAPEIASELGVDALVEGSVLREGDRVGVWAQLIHGPTDTHLWADEYNREARDVLVLLSEVARAISGEIRVALTPDEEYLLAAPKPVDPEAHKVYLRARHHLNQFSGAGTRKALELFESAIVLDPTFAPAHSGLAGAYLMASLGRTPPREILPAARKAALEAIALDDRIAEAYTVSGWVNQILYWDWPAAKEAFERALELNPNDATARHGYADYLTAMGRPEEALEHVLLGRASDPFSRLAHVPVIGHLGFLRREDEVIEESRKTLELFPDFGFARRSLGGALLRKGLHEEGFAELSKAPGDPALSQAFEQGFADGGIPGAKLAVAKVLAVRSESRYVDPLAIARNYAGGGEIEAALVWLEKAIENRSPLVVLIGVSPDFDSLRSDPRYLDLEQRIGLPSRRAATS